MRLQADDENDVGDAAAAAAADDDDDDENGSSRADGAATAVVAVRLKVYVDVKNELREEKRNSK